MRMKERLACLIVVCCVFTGIAAVPVSAAAIPPIEERNIVLPLGTDSFNIYVPANGTVRANNSFLLMSGETITVKASYAPFLASVDVGFIAPDGKFYYFNVTGGSIDQTIIISQTGRYTLQFRNNSDAEIQVSGFVNY